MLQSARGVRHEHRMEAGPCTCRVFVTSDLVATGGNQTQRMASPKSRDDNVKAGNFFFFKRDVLQCICTTFGTGKIIQYCQLKS